MKNKLNELDFIKIANKIYIEPTKEVIEHVKHEYFQLEESLSNLKAIDVTNVEPLTRISLPISYLRDDEFDQSLILDKKLVLENANEKNDEYILIKRIVK